MTVRETLEKLLVDHGLWPNEAHDVFELYMSELAKTDTYMYSNVERAASDYPQPLINLLFLGMKKHVVSYIDACCPEHWARGMFE